MKKSSVCNYSFGVSMKQAIGIGIVVHQFSPHQLNIMIESFEDHFSKSSLSVILLQLCSPIAHRKNRVRTYICIV